MAAENAAAATAAPAILPAPAQAAAPQPCVWEGAFRLRTMASVVRLALFPRVALAGDTGSAASASALLLLPPAAAGVTVTKRLALTAAALAQLLAASGACVLAAQNVAAADSGLLRFLGEQGVGAAALGGGGSVNLVPLTHATRALLPAELVRRAAAPPAPDALVIIAPA